ncbi:uncharacterized protein LOC131434987 [Malaya genurostris]|uniref:uncharacterized protein LOC131434987 n=1 Tax=Malaya genurostris TaxID=325434 RepID=UPI0026F4089C|nr:uncharacterized protein LOC131434987 [Malaya genurostris]XP_058458366.1 uncharacterized protein LOC131434987 [Malaya genurostris]
MFFDGAYFSIRICSGSHELWRCEDYKKANLSDRYTTLRRTGACFNCLQKGHRTTECTSEHSCKRCGKRHHTTLHNDEDRSKNHEERPTTSSNKATQQMTIVEETVVAPTHEESKKPDSSSTFCTQIQATNQQMLLSTAVILVQGKEGNTYPCRVLLDSGSQTNFISEQFTQLLSLKKESANVSVSGLNDIRTRIRFKIQTTIRSRISNYAVCLELLVVPKITGNLPLTKVDVLSLTLPAGAELADPYYNVPGRVDMLLGAEIFYDMLMLGRLRLPNSTALLQETQFGWVLSGPVPNENRKSVSSFCTTIDEDIGEIVNRFWQIESYCESQNEISSTEAECIQHFQETHERTVEGRYVVRLPFNELKPQLGDSRNMAIKRFQGLEQRLDKNPEMKHQYTEFLREYESLGHMKEITLDVTEDPRTVYYLPHHYVLKPSSSTTKLRVVFDGSAASDSGVSINQTQMIGPCVQNDLVSILLNFRSYKYAFTADIPKMYRQVGVNKDDVRYQRIVWRENLNQSLRTFDLQTVTYGLKSSPFLATMVLCQLADDEEENFPMAANVVKRSSYMDDVLTGANTLEGAIELKNQVAGLLAKGCFDIHKFCSNSEELLSEIPEEKREDGVNIGNSNFNVLMKTLGVAWDPQDDMFTFLVPVDIPWTSYLTKRKILSQIAKIFDPLGFLGPVITSAKIIMRELWSLDLQWDQPVPTEMEQLWGEFHRQLCSLNDVRIPRWIFCEEVCEYELHGFADASDLAYGACIYSRLLRRDGTVNMRLLCSKSRILPKKKEKQKQITTPRAELLAAVLVSKLAVKLLAALDTKFQHVVLWSDSQIVLCWISKSLDALPVYVGNRVREIQQLTGSFIWRYIPSKENPADLISRGVPPQDLAQCQIWWYGPPALQSTHPAIQPPEPIADEDVPEIKRIVLLTSPIQPRLAIFNRVSRLLVIQRAMAYVIRFCDYIRAGRKQLTKGLPNCDEMMRASKLIVRLVQKESFELELKAIKSNKEIPNTIRNLNPIIEDGVMRVGGRLKHAAIPYEQKHQVLLPEKHPYTICLIRHLHRSNLHVGQRGLLALVRQQYWPLRVKNTIRKLIHSCIPCFRMKPSKSTQLMGNLPDYRVQPSPVFHHTGVDFAGPFQIRSNLKLRNAAVTKGYVCVFVCMATRALHLEAVSDLTSEAFMGALQRFVSRRGLVRRLYSDNATNFEGAFNEMRRLAQLFQDEQHQRLLNEYCTQNNIDWSFIPPRSPHFGGIWEAGVKSTKFHLKSVLAEHKLSYEELSTVLAQIEAILNSRPLTPVSNDPNDYSAITPAHFLIGRELHAIPEPSYSHIPAGRLSRWQFVQDLKQKFWKRWVNDYLHELQTRQKDFKVTKFRVGALVLLVDENTSSLRWALGRITELCPGPDGHTRVVRLKTQNGTTTRAVKKVCLLPLDNEEP